MTQSNQQETWTPAQVAEAGVEVRVGFHGDVRIYQDIDKISERSSPFNRADGESRTQWIDRTYAEATRIAKEREGVDVWWWDEAHGSTIRFNPTANMPGFIKVDNRIVGETPEDELRLLSAWATFDFLTDDEQQTLKRLFDRHDKANVDIAAARKETK